MRPSGSNQLAISSPYIPLRTALQRSPESRSIASVAPCERAWLNDASAPAPMNDR